MSETKFHTHTEAQAKFLARTEDKYAYKILIGNPQDSMEELIRNTQM
jgi:hypothetical protein